MILTITIVLGSLITLNFLLLFFSCNSTKKPQKENTQPKVINKPITTQEVPAQLAPTGS